MAHLHRRRDLGRRESAHRPASAPDEALKPRPTFKVRLMSDRIVGPNAFALRGCGQRRLCLLLLRGIEALRLFFCASIRLTTLGGASTGAAAISSPAIFGSMSVRTTISGPASDRETSASVITDTSTPRRLGSVDGAVMLNEYQELRTRVRNLGQLSQKRSAGAVTSYSQFSLASVSPRSVVH
jgi:hypothetical protein